MKMINKEDVLEWIDYAMWDTDDVPQSEAQIALNWLWKVRDDIREKIKEVPAIPIEWIENWMKGELYKSDVIRMLSDWEKTKEYDGMNFWEILVKEYQEGEKENNQK